tara:strand:+ start:453 stop:770 length:318 start_codon:yes stop_codon:yes gene_type:complete
LVIRDAENVLQQRRFYRLAAHRPQWGRHVEGLADHPDLPQIIKLPKTASEPLNGELPRCGIDQESDKIDCPDANCAKKPNSVELGEDKIGIGILDKEENNSHSKY